MWQGKAGAGGGGSHYFVISGGGDQKLKSTGLANQPRLTPSNNQPADENKCQRKHGRMYLRGKCKHSGFILVLEQLGLI
jgi:hypothetical protein